MSDSFFIREYSITNSGYVQIVLENDDLRRIYGNVYIDDGEWFGDKISFTDEYCYYVCRNKLWRAKLDNAPIDVYPSGKTFEGGNGYYIQITEWNDNK